MITPDDWAIGYARQAGADLETWDVLQDLESVPECHKLLFLQMGCEKLAKAHLCGAGSDPDVLQTSHAYVAKNLPVIVRQQLALFGIDRKSAARISQHSKRLSREIELLAPAVDRGGRRPDNCEYPWDDGVQIRVPLDWSFTPSQLLTEPAGRTFLKLIRAAINRILTQ